MNLIKEKEKILHGFGYDGKGATALWLPLAIHGRFNPGRWNYCVDCGIDKGQYSLHYSRMFEKVTSIDSCIRNETQLILGDVKNVKLIERCLWSIPGTTMTWYEVEGHTFVSSILKSHIQEEVARWGIHEDKIKSYNVLTETLDNLINSPVDFLKIDCERVDTEVLLGAEKLIKKYRPTIQVEYELDEIEIFLSKFSYEQYRPKERNFMDVIYLPK